MDENAQQFSDRQESVESVVFRKMETDRYIPRFPC